MIGLQIGICRHPAKFLVRRDQTFSPTPCSHHLPPCPTLSYHASNLNLTADKARLSPRLTFMTPHTIENGETDWFSHRPRNGKRVMEMNNARGPDTRCLVEVSSQTQNSRSTDYYSSSSPSFVSYQPIKPFFLITYFIQPVLHCLGIRVIIPVHICRLWI